jgi:23S rRNA pseudouridine1911/1915/1917 synthase
MNHPRAVEARVERPQDVGIRLDVFIAERLGLFTRSQARSRVLSLAVNGAPARMGRKLKLGDVVVLSYADPPASDLRPENLPLSILFENDEVIVIDKPQGLVVHPGSGNQSGTLVNALLFHAQNLAAGFPPGDPRPGIVHRLDKETSGVIIVAKNASAHHFLAGQFQDRSVRKRYIAVVRGSMPSDRGRIETRLARDPRDRKKFACVSSGGRIAVTRYRVLRAFAAGKDTYAFVLLAPRTGRTHQLRVHMRHLGSPILGDPLYGRGDARFPEATLLLHARSLAIRLPGDAQARTFMAPVPERFRSILRQLQSFSPRNGL